MTTAAVDHRVTRDELRRLIEAIERRPAPPAVRRVERLPIEAALRGDWQRTEDGALRREEVLPLDHVHGTQVLADLRSSSPEALALLGGDPELAQRSVSDLLFLDIETTGLGGSGAMVFLVTTGQLIADGFRIRQYLAPSPAEEGSLLTELAADSGVHETRPVLATYNGRVFDAPMLDQRATMHRMRGGYEALTQLDVLSPMRHGFRATLPSCRLSAVEYDLLKVTRPPDEVGGGDIPGWYFRFVRGGDHRYLEPLITHNAIDVISLAALTARLAAVLDGAVSASGIEHLAAGRLWLRAGESDRAERHLNAALDVLDDGWASQQALLVLATLHKRAGQRELAAPLWERAAEQPQGPVYPALLELAKYHEHAARDYAAALAVVERAIASVGRDAALMHRRARLLRRLGRDGSDEGSTG